MIAVVDSIYKMVVSFSSLITVMHNDVNDIQLQGQLVDLEDVINTPQERVKAIFSTMDSVSVSLVEKSAIGLSREIRIMYEAQSVNNN